LSPDIPLLLQRVYALRGITSMQELDYTTRNLCNYDNLDGTHTAVEIALIATSLCISITWHNIYARVRLYHA
jgi:hypothetical protein